MLKVKNTTFRNIQATCMEILWIWILLHTRPENTLSSILDGLLRIQGSEPLGESLFRFSDLAGLFKTSSTMNIHIPTTFAPI